MAVEALRKSLRHRSTNTTEQYCARIRTNDAFVRKYDLNGDEVWTRQFGTSAFDDINCIAVDEDMRVYVDGGTSGALPGQSNSGGRDAFVRRYDSKGDEVWTLQFGTPDFDRAFGIAVSDQNVFVGGDTNGALPGQTNAGLLDSFIVKLIDED